MKVVWIALALIFAALAQSQPLAPAPTEKSNPPQKTTQKPGRPANKDQRGTEDRPLFVTVTGIPVVEVQGGPKAEPKPAETANKKNDDPTRYWGLPADAWTALFTGALVIIGFVTGGVLICQSMLLRRQVNLAREEFNTTARAFVFVDGFNTVLFTREQTEGPGEYEFSDGSWRGPRKLENRLFPTYFSIQPRWRNAGSTPTRNMTTKVKWRPLELNGTLEPLEYIYTDPEERHFLGPKAIETSTFIEIPTVYALNSIRLMSGMTPIATIGSNEYASFFPWIIVWGRADYLDIFDRPHFVEWCYRIEFACPEGKKLTARFTQWGDYNRTDHDA
jgi:hypothetical protein